MTPCECDWKYHQDKACTNPAAELSAGMSSPALCTPCLYSCCEEAEEERQVETVLLEGP